MANCPACGRDNPAGFLFCGFCTSPLVSSEGHEVRKIVTVLFSDVTGSTSLGELLDPESLRNVMSRYFDLARTVVQRHGGTVEKFIGDAVMAVFGVPSAHEDDALRAVRAATEMRENLAELNDELERSSGVRLETRTGVNSGEVVAGDTSSGQSFVSGDTVNVAARLEQAAQPGEILIGSGTLSLVRDAVRVEATEPLPLKGKAEPVPAFRLLDVLAGAPALARRLDSPMVGRDDELRRVVDAFDLVERGRSCELLTIVGEAGVGKTRLTIEVLSRLADRATVLEGRCLPYGEGITFWPLAEMVRRAAGIDDGDPPAHALAKIAALLNGNDDAWLVRDRVGAAIGLSDATGAIQETFWATRRLLEALAADRPVVAVFRRHPLGGADAPGSPPVRGGLQPGTPGAPALHGAAGASGDPTGVGPSGDGHHAFAARPRHERRPDPEPDRLRPSPGRDPRSHRRDGRRQSTLRRGDAAHADRRRRAAT